MCLDETGITTNLLRRYGRAPRGARVHDHAPCGRWQTSTFLAPVRVTGLTAPGVFEIGSEGGLPLPSAHTTVRTVPYTAVQVLRCRSRS